MRALLRLRILAGWLGFAGVALVAGNAVAQPQRTPQSPERAKGGTSSEINVSVGGTHLISARNVRNYSEGRPGVIDVKLTSDSSQFVIVGRTPGSTTLLLIRHDGSEESYVVNVSARSASAVEQELKQLLAGIPTVRVSRVGNRTVIDGYVQDESEKTRIDRVVSLYGGQVESVVSLGATGATTPQELRSGVGRTVLVRIDFYFVQLDASSGYAIGIGWPRSYGGTAATASVSYDLLKRAYGHATLTVNQPLPQLDLVEDNGWGKVLRHATVLTNNGEEAQFSSGGEQNFTVNTGLTVGLQRVNYGIELTVVPRFDPTRREVQLSLKADVSDLAPPGSGTTVPGRTSTKLASAINVKLGQSIVLSGIRATSESHTTSGLPLLSRIPILGVLFGSQRSSEAQSEAALYVVPNVIESVSPASEELIQRAVARFKDFGGTLGEEALPPVSTANSRRKP
jgi:pilus assembly protein CpaC